MCNCTVENTFLEQGFISKHKVCNTGTGARGRGGGGQFASLCCFLEQALTFPIRLSKATSDTTPIGEQKNIKQNLARQKNALGLNKNDAGHLHPACVLRR